MVPRYWYVIAAVALVTAALILLARPRKRRRGSRWKG
jgi:hypothetical protein